MFQHTAVGEGTAVVAMSDETTRSTCAGYGTVLTPLQEGDSTAAGLHRLEAPTIAVHPRPGKVGWCWQLVGICMGCNS